LLWPVKAASPAAGFTFSFPFFGTDALGQLNMQIRRYVVDLCKHDPSVSEQGATAGFRGHSEKIFEIHNKELIRELCLSRQQSRHMQVEKSAV
jgi:hypothetical protein